MPRLGSRMLAAVVAIPLLFAQTDQPTTFRSDTRLVVLHATVIDRSGRLVTNLQQKAFRVRDGNRRIVGPAKRAMDPHDRRLP